MGLVDADDVDFDEDVDGQEDDDPLIDFGVIDISEEDPWNKNN